MSQDIRTYADFFVKAFDLRSPLAPLKKGGTGILAPPLKRKRGIGRV